MNFFRRTLNATAPAALGVLLLAGSASAITIINESGSTSTFGSITSAISAGSSGTVSAGQFNQVATDAAIQAACPVGFTCSASTLTEIDFDLTTNLSANITVKGTGSSSYVGSINGLGGTFGHPTSGTAVNNSLDADLNDGITDVVVDVPTFSVATTTEKGLGCAGTPSPTHFTNCLATAAGTGTNYTGTGTDSETGSYTGDLSAVTGTYVGDGTGAGNVTFSLGVTSLSTSGSLINNATVPTNIGIIEALSNALEIDYLYSYTETAIPSSPEPTTMALVGGALLAIGLIRKKRIN